MLEPHKQNASNLQTTSKQCMVQSNQIKQLFNIASKLIVPSSLPAQSSIELGVDLVVRTTGQCKPAASALCPVTNPTTGQVDSRLPSIR